MKNGSLRRRGKKGTWQYRASYGTHPDGRPNMRSTSFPAKLAQKDAEAAARKIRTQWDREHERGAEHRETLGYLIDQWEANADHSPNTTARNASIVAAIRRDLGHIKLADLTARHLDQWYRDLGRATRNVPGTNPPETVPVRGPNTVRHYHRVIKGILKQGMDWDMLDRNVADKARPPKKAEIDETPYVPTLAALGVIIGHASTKAKLGIRIAADTGCREGEVCGLRWSDITGSMMHVRRSAYKVPGKPVGVKVPKNGASKRIPLPPNLVSALAAHRVWQRQEAERHEPGVVVGDDAYVLANLAVDASGRTPFAPAWLAQEWERANRKAGTAFKFHGIRHMHGSLLVDANVAPATAAKRQGHTLAVFQERYAHALEQSDMEAAEVIGELTAGLYE